MKHLQLSQMYTYPCFTVNLISISNADFTFRFDYLQHTILTSCSRHTLWSSLPLQMNLYTYHCNLISNSKQCNLDGLTLASTIAYLILNCLMISWIYFYFFMNLFCLPFLLLRLTVFNSEDHSELILVSLILVGCRNFGGLRKVIV
jgi:hypothetical protein